METTTAVPRIFRLQGLFIPKKNISLSYIKYPIGFSARNPGEQQSQWPGSKNFCFLKYANVFLID
jgi:hypothetical protein